MLLFAWFLVLAGSVLAGGGSSSSRGGGGASAMRAYTNLHRSLLEPIGLYNARPQIVAPVSPPFRGRNKVADMQNYLRNLYNHDAYIDPESGAGLERLRGNMMWILNHPNDPRIRDYQCKPVLALPSIESASAGCTELLLCVLWMIRWSCFGDGGG